MDSRELLVVGKALCVALIKCASLLPISVYVQVQRKEKEKRVFKKKLGVYFP